VRTSTVAATGALAVALAALVAVGTGAAPAGARDSNPYQQQLQGQVEDANGAPKAGRDPANQRQVPLAVAAGRPHVVAKGPQTPVTGRRAAGTTVKDPATTKVLVSGCAVGYGDAGQCLPARAPGGARLTCRYVVTMFPHGVRVTGQGKDRLGLDSDRDGTACGPGDAGVPAAADMAHMSGH